MIACSKTIFLYIIILIIILSIQLDLLNAEFAKNNQTDSKYLDTDSDFEIKIKIDQRNQFLISISSSISIL